MEGKENIFQYEMRAGAFEMFLLHLMKTLESHAYKFYARIWRDLENSRLISIDAKKFLELMSQTFDSIGKFNSNLSQTAAA